MTTTRVVRLKKSGKPKIKSRKKWAAFCDGLAADVAAGTLKVVGDDDEAQAEARARVRASDACDDCCGSGNVRLCGQFVALCDNGESCVLGV